MSIGEPQHAPPPFVLEALRAQPAIELGSYPGDRRPAGAARARARALADAALRAAGRAASIRRRMVLPVNGTREALFAFVQAVVDPAPARRWSRCRTRSTRSTRARRCWPAPSRYYLDTTAGERLPARPGRRAGEPSGSAASCCSCAARATRRGAVLSLEYFSARAGAGRAPRLHHRLRRVLRGHLPRRGRAAARPARGRRRQRPRRLRALRGVPQPVQALERAGAALGLRRRRSRAASSASCSTAPTTAARCRCRRSAASIAAWDDDAHVRGEPRALPREVRRACCRMLAPVLRGRRRPAGAFYLWPDVRRRRRALRARAVRARRTSPCCPAATWRATRDGGNPGARPRAHLARAAGRASASRLPSASAISCASADPCQTRAP